MFTGIVEKVGTVRKAREGRGLLELEIEAKGIAGQVKRGDSVAVERLGEDVLTVYERGDG